MVKVFYDKDASLDALKGKTVAVIGYGSQGRAQALNLRDSGVEVIVGLRGEGKSFEVAKTDGFSPIPIEEAAERGDVILMLVPDVPMSDVYARFVRPHLRKGKALVFAHGYNIHYQRIVPPPDVDVIMVAPKAPGPLLRRQYQEKRGVPALIAVHRDVSGRARELALGIAKALGCTRAGVVETSFKDEAETDLFGEQTVLVGGVSELIKKGFEVLVESGYPPELAYFEVCNELKLIVDLIYAGGLSNMFGAVSDTAKYGGLVVGPRVIDDHVKENMRRVLNEIRTGRFADEWTGNPDSYEILRKKMEELERHPLETVGRELRRMQLI
ncbi:MAG: ketol-acid reductoisomerase [Aigarchaeota archaeon]|nr:ketol-acid reductoisomerase [Aigarchaeota archaeon]MDW8092172.1 ketol-acid reductoisomerase [Nitrososphaerota archaeon]